MPSEKGVDERSYGCAAGENDQYAEKQQGDDHRQKPEFFPGPEISPDVMQNIHGNILKQRGLSGNSFSLRLDAGNVLL
jgi:hypothetical protein